MKKYIYVPAEIHRKMVIQAAQLGRKLQDVAAEACELWLKSKPRK